MYDKKIINCVSKELWSYIQNNVLKHYEEIDIAHNKEHIVNVIIRSIDMGNEYGMDKNIILACSAYHDLGLLVGRENHERNSALFFKKDQFMRTWFSNEEIELIIEAIEDHRAISKNGSRSIYGAVLHDVDTFGGDLSELMKRSIGYGKKYFNHYSKEQHFERIFEYLNRKYGNQGYANMYMKYTPHQKNLEEIKTRIRTKDEVKNIFDTYFVD